MLRKLLCGLCLLFPALHSYGQVPLPDPQPEAPAGQQYFFKNLGQLVTDSGQVVTNVAYYTQRSSPQVFAQSRGVSLCFRNRADSAGVTDSAFRIDWNFACQNPGACGTISVSEQGSGQLNYYLPQCPAGITGVPGHARLTYENAFPNIDLHFYSNGSGLKNYFVVRPGGNPNDIGFVFGGQDSLSLLPNGNLQLKIKGRIVVLPRPVAYQIDASNNPVALGWQPSWSVQSGLTVKITNIGSYNSGLPLVLRVARPYSKVTGNDNLDWSTYYGGEGTEHWSSICADVNGDVYQGMTEAGNFFPAYNGSQRVSGGNMDVYFSKFNQYAERVWGTYFGGSGNETIGAIANGVLVNSDVGGFYVGGATTSYDLPVSGGDGFAQTTYGGQYGPGNAGDGMLASFDKATGTMSWSTYFGGSGNDGINSIAVDNTKLYLAGITSHNTQSNLSSSCNSPTSTGTFSLCPGNGSRYFQGVPAGGSDCFLAEFDLATRKLSWSTFLGGPGNDEPTDMLFINRNGFKSLYLCGYTTSKSSGSSFPSPVISPLSNSFPLADPGNGSYFQKTAGTNGGDGFICRFDANNQLSWSTFFGGSNDDKLWSLAANSANEIYAAGYTMSSQAAPASAQANSNGYFPVYTAKSSAYFQPSFGGGQSDAVFTQFSNTGQLRWSTYYGGSGDENIKAPINTSLTAVDDLDNVYVAGYSNVDYSGLGGNVPVFYAFGSYWQSANASTGQSAMLKDDGWILMFNAAHKPVWGTHFGGTTPPNSDPAINAHEIFTDIALTGHSYLFLTGLTTCPATPTRCPSPGAYCDDSYNFLSDAFISRFSIRNMATSVPGTLPGNTGLFDVYPNPSDAVYHVRLTGQPGNASEYTLRITNSTGALISSGTLRRTAGQTEFRIDLSGLQPGVYFAEISDGRSRDSQKLVKSR